MEENERDTMLILASFEKELGEVEKVKYYENFETKKVEISGVFFTEEKDADGNISYHLYYRDSSNEILSIDHEGNVQIDPKWKQVIGDIDLEDAIEINDRKPGRLKGISEKSSPEEMKKALKEKEEQDEEIQEIEQDLEEQGEDLRISKYRKIEDSHVDERMPEVFKNGTENGIAFSNKLNRYVIISKVNGHYQLNDNVEPAQMTWKTIISIAPNGEKVERKVPHALMQLPNNPEKEVAVILDEYGEASIETVNVLPCQERVARAVRHEGDGQEREESLEMRNEFKAEGIEYEHDIAHQVEDIEQEQREANETVDYDITEDDYIPNTEMTWGELMENTGESLPKLIERYNREMVKEGANSKDVVETIEYDYGNVEHQHKR